MHCDSDRILQLLEAHLGERVVPITDTVMEKGLQPDLLVRTGNATLIVECKHQASTEAVGAALHQILSYQRSLSPGVIPIIAVPYMGSTGRRLCVQAGVSWMDLSGNAEITFPGVRVLVEGRPNQFIRRGRPSNLFAPKASRIPHALLLAPGVAHSQEELVSLTGLSKGHVSTMVRRLADAGLVLRDKGGLLRPRDPDLLLDTWRDAYTFENHDIHRGQVAVRSSGEMVARLAAHLERESYALTGLAAAWRYAAFAMFRTVAVYVPRLPSGSVLSELGFQRGVRSGNLWLVIPKDEGVFIGARRVGGVQCVSPIQTYLDLKAQPERAEEAADALRGAEMNWSADDR